MNKQDFKIGDLLIKKGEVGILYEIKENPYGFLYTIYWAWCEEGNSGTITLPDLILCERYFDQFTIIKGRERI
jgi:hypothetical protein